MFVLYFVALKPFCDNVDFLQLCYKSREEICWNVCPYNLVTSWSSFWNSFPLQLVLREPLVTLKLRAADIRAVSVLYGAPEGNA
jgi:hypothetical protein